MTYSGLGQVLGDRNLPVEAIQIVCHSFLAIWVVHDGLLDDVLSDGLTVGLAELAEPLRVLLALAVERGLDALDCADIVVAVVAIILGALALRLCLPLGLC